jgi:soluble lytic murein transglycosylase
MKRESAFNNDAVSRSGAVGLMQLLPATADRFRSSKKEDIRDSGTNIKLAAMYLKDLVKRYNGNLAYAAAAYNSGEEALDRWIKWYGDRLSGTEFIENIPYSETRAYVKSVLGNYFMYNAVYLKKHVTFDEVVKGGVK